MKVIPTLLEQNFDKAVERVKKVKDLSSWIQVDVIDGEFSYGKSFELELLGRLENTERVLWDIHLMVKKPEKWIEKCVFVGASRVIGQVEMMGDREEFVKKVKDEGMEAGLGFDIETEIGDIPKETDLVLLMARKAGFEAAEFEEKTWERIRKVKALGFKVGIDGGVKKELIERLKEEGVLIVYSGSQFEKIVNDEN